MCIFLHTDIISIKQQQHTHNIESKNSVWCSADLSSVLNTQVWCDWTIFHVTQKCSSALLSTATACCTHFNRQTWSWQQLTFNTPYNIYSHGPNQNTVITNASVLLLLPARCVLWLWEEAGMDLKWVSACDELFQCFLNCQMDCL